MLLPVGVSDTYAVASGATSVSATAMHGVATSNSSTAGFKRPGTMLSARLGVRGISHDDQCGGPPSSIIVAKQAKNTCVDGGIRLISGHSKLPRRRCGSTATVQSRNHSVLTWLHYN